MKIHFISQQLYSPDPPQKRRIGVETSNYMPEINSALNELSKVQFSLYDLKYIKSLGVKPPFESGKEICDFIKNNNIDIKFEQINPPSVHAQFVHNPNGRSLIYVNSKYQNTKNFAEILAISSSLAHEAGHAKDFDNLDSIQEELDCLSLNVLVHRYFKKMYNDPFKDSNSFIVREGVGLYDDLFFDKSKEKTALKSRVYLKYGDLPAGDLKHPASTFSYQLKSLN